MEGKIRQNGLPKAGGFVSLGGMSWFGFPSKDDGACLVWKYPQNEDRHPYEFVAEQVKFTMAGVPLDGGHLLMDLRCTKCGFESRIPPDERGMVDEVAGLTRKLRKGELSQGEYEAIIKAVPARFIKDLLALTQEWKCAECGEENPVTFGTCWKCQSKHSKGQPELSEDAKPLPGFKTHTNPWDV